MLLYEAYDIVISLATLANNELQEGIPKQRNEEAIELLSNFILDHMDNNISS